MIIANKGDRRIICIILVGKQYKELYNYVSINRKNEYDMLPKNAMELLSKLLEKDNAEEYACSLFEKLSAKEVDRLRAMFSEGEREILCQI